MSDHLLIQGDAARLPLPDKSVDLVLGSPPYCDARTYGIGAQRGCVEWVEWMLKVMAEAVRVSRGLVLWVCAGVTRDHCYWPACEGLLWEWWKRGGKCWRPAYWHRVGIPGSGGKKWLRADVEYALCFKGEGNDFWTDNTACGHVPKWAPGGAMSYRDQDGIRKNAFGVRTDAPIGTRREVRKASTEQYRARKTLKPHLDVAYRRTFERPDGTIEVQAYAPPVLANPGTYHEWDFTTAELDWHEQAVVHATVGGGKMGSGLAHENEAPYPEALAEFFVRSFCPPGGIVLDPFSGSGTTVAVAQRFDRHGIGLDLRWSQCELGSRRIAESLRPVSNLEPKSVKPAAGQLNLFAS